MREAVDEDMAGLGEGDTIEARQSVEELIETLLVDALLEMTLLPANVLAIEGCSRSRVCGCRMVDMGEC